MFLDLLIFKFEEDYSKLNERLYCVEFDLGMVGNYKICFCGNFFFFIFYWKIKFIFILCLYIFYCYI